MKRWHHLLLTLFVGVALSTGCSDDDNKTPTPDAGVDSVVPLDGAAHPDQGSDTGPAAGWAQIAVGNAHVCGIDLDGKVWCWGDGVSGQLGQGVPMSRSTPVAVQGVDGAAIPGKATWVTAGWGHSCAVFDTGQAYCWGANDSYQLGDGTFDDSAEAIPVAGLDDAVLIDAGGKHTCATRSDQTVWCWGLNADGELGDGTDIDQTTPKQVPDMAGVVSVEAGIWNTCVSTSAGIGYCWGDNGGGQVGDGSSGDVKYDPVQVAGVTNIATISVGESHVCALTLAGEVYCWGENSFGEMGSRSLATHPTPEKVMFLTQAMASVATGLGFSCAAMDGGALSCWGRNENGQLGDGSTDNSALPVTVSGVSGADWVGAGDDHACALVGASAYCWGLNSDGQLGDGSNTSSSTPKMVLVP